MIVSDVVRKYIGGQEIFRRRSIGVLIAHIEELEALAVAQQKVAGDLAKASAQRALKAANEATQMLGIDNEPPSA